jgi:hypothetical protein
MKLVKIIAISALLVAGNTANSFADSSNFAGPYIGIAGSAVGVAMDGKHTDGDADASVTKGAAGAVTLAVGIEVGYNVPVSDVAFITLAASYNPVDAEFKADDAANANDVTVTFDDIMEVSIEPSFSVTSNTAFFVKAGYSEFTADAKGTGLAASQTFDITGETFALGTKTITDNGVFIKSEVGMTTYGGFTLKDVGTDLGSATINDIDVAYGKIVIGKKF